MSNTINWKDEQLEGQPIYDAAEAVRGRNFNNIHFRISNLQEAGTPANAGTMTHIIQKTQSAKSFYYDGSHTAVYPFGESAQDGTSSGILLAVGFEGQRLWANGMVYLIATEIPSGNGNENDNESIVQINNPRNSVIARDCMICCALGREVGGMVSGG